MLALLHLKDMSEVLWEICPKKVCSQNGQVCRASNDGVQQQYRAQ